MPFRLLRNWEVLFIDWPGLYTFINNSVYFICLCVRPRFTHSPATEISALFRLICEDVHVSSEEVVKWLNGENGTFFSLSQI